jgi:queuosine precursor transporter
VDSAIFYPLAFYNTGIIPDDALLKVVVAQFVTKTLVEVVFTPMTYAVVGFLKRAENEDYYDRDTDFNPFRLEA